MQQTLSISQLWKLELSIQSLISLKIDIGSWNITITWEHILMNRTEQKNKIYIIYLDQ